MPDFFDHLARLLQPSWYAIAIMAGLAVIALALVLAKVAEFQSCGIGDGKRAETFVHHWRMGRPDGTMPGRTMPRSAAEKALATALVLLEQRRPKFEIEERVGLQANTDLCSLSRGLPALKAIAWTTPVAGICATVLAIIQVIRTSHTDADILMTFAATAAGLIVSAAVLLSVFRLENRLHAERTTIKVLTASLLAE